MGRCIFVTSVRPAGLRSLHGTETEIGRMVRVEAWNPATGTAQVVDPKRGAMRPATDYEDFSHLEKADQVVATVPRACLQRLLMGHHMTHGAAT
jgi:hypothetical protein